MRLSHYRDREKREVDLVIEGRDRVAAIEVKAGSGGDAASLRGLTRLLVDGVRAVGYSVDAVTRGRVQPLPSDIEAVAYRSLQEMVTNALRHGEADPRLSVRQEWGDDILIEVRNRVVASSPAAGGAGIRAMEARLVVAASLYLSEAIIKSHLASVLRKLGLRDRVQLVVFAYDHGLTRTRQHPRE